MEQVNIKKPSFLCCRCNLLHPVLANIDKDSTWHTKKTRIQEKEEGLPMSPFHGCLVTEAIPTTAERAWSLILFLLPALHTLCPSLTIRTVLLAHFSPINRNSLYLAAGLYTNYLTVKVNIQPARPIRKKLFSFSIFIRLPFSCTTK
jgi:hypothetical protein